MNRLGTATLSLASALSVGTARTVGTVAFVVSVGSVATAQSQDARIAKADSLHDSLQPVSELIEVKSILASDPGSYAALWRAAEAEVDIAKQIRGEHESSRKLRDSVYEVAAEYARRAIAADSMGADGHFTLALALGELSRTRGGKERVQFARTIYDEAARAIALDSTQDGAEHILGAWHAEVMRLSSVQRFFAKLLFGAGFMDRASWDSAVVHLKRAVAIRPDYLFHRLELAQVYADLDRWAEADEQLAVIPTLPDTDVLDKEHRAEAAALKKRVERELSRSHD